jgi:polyphosphate kinase
MNGISDSAVVRALVQASKDGVKIDIVCRGICTLRPQVSGISDNIRVISVVGRFLEHSRIYRFENAGSPEVFIGSADLRPRNLSRRVELLAPVADPEHHRVLDRILSLYVEDPTGWELGADGAYRQRHSGGESAQSALMSSSQGQ